MDLVFIGGDGGARCFSLRWWRAWGGRVLRGGGAIMGGFMNVMCGGLLVIIIIKRDAKAINALIEFFVWRRDGI
jgi:hypothetical protein